MSSVRRAATRYRLSLLLRRHRRALTAVLLGLATLAGLRAVQQAQAPITAPPAAAARAAPDRWVGVPAGWVLVTVRPADPAAGAMLRPGDRADVIAGAALDPLGAPGGSGRTGTGAQLVVPAALVVEVPAAAPGSGAPGAGPGGGLWGSLDGSSATAGRPGGAAGTLVLAVSRTDAVRLAGYSGSRQLTLAALPPGSPG